MQRSVIPGKTMTLGEAFEVGKKMLGHLEGFRLIVGVTEVNPTSHRPRRSGRAAAMGILPGASFAVVERARRRRLATEEKVELGSREKQRMAKFLESAAPAAECAAWSQAGDRLVELLIQRP